MGYHLEGRLLEVCNCEVLCPCWIGEDPDNDTCDSVMAWHFDKGQIEGVDVSGLTLAMIVHIPGNVLDGNWKAAAYVDDAASPEQEAALLKVYTGEAGGPVAELVQLVGEVVSVERAPIEFKVSGGAGTVRVGDVAFAEMENYLSGAGEPTTLSDTIFSTVPGAPVFVAKAKSFRAENAKVGVSQNLSDHNALQSVFMFDN
ncbi:DUF1326 domain-containing protein [Sneathiella chinensis]|uniref:DUF1326 domain-containing protein n=1 Tax=Sneathiella chinensis TaxID=349750 RepID=A0ABQ5U674_9PROT|nr:DUF1326 domain-containing protein [Sneathiella chinensis]GLQ06807.1 hypothetical protein GCM10007924_20280 [Sneathiella chinensis]